MKARLVVFRDGRQELCVPISAPLAGIGRDTGNHVQLTMPEISKRHAIVEYGSDGLRIRDLNSRNGLFVNGAKVQEAKLKDGDRLALGPYTLVFEIEKAQHTYKPVMEIDVSSKAAQQTMQTPNRPR